MRTATERKADVLRRFSEENEAWVASANVEGEGYMIPLTYLWANDRFLFSTVEKSRTARDLRRAGKTRISLPSTSDVVIVDGAVTFHDASDVTEEIDRFVARHTWDPRRSNGYVFFTVAPRRIQAWNAEPELHGRVIMVDGSWRA